MAEPENSKVKKYGADIPATDEYVGSTVVMLRG